MDSFSLQCFLMLAEQLNFTKAAYAMNVSQPTLSRIIAGLERDIGTALFCRSKQGISLTNAGQEFMLHAENIVRNWEVAVRRAQLAENRKDAKVRIGFLPAMCMEFLPALVNRMRQKHPEVELVLEPHDSEKLAFEFNEGNLDLVLMMNWKTELLNNYWMETIYQDDYCVAMHRDHRQANKDFIEIKELSEETILFYKVAGDFRTRDLLEPGALATQIELAYKTQPCNTKTVSDLIGLMILLECKEGIAILPSHLKRFGFPAIKFVKLRVDDADEDFSFHGIMCWHRDNNAPAVCEVRRMLREVAGGL